MRLWRRACVPVSAVLPGDLDDLRAAVAATSEAGEVTIEEDEPGRLRLAISHGWGTPHGGSRAGGVLGVTEQPGPSLRIEGELYSGWLNHTVLVVPFVGLATLLLVPGLLLLVADPEAIGLLIVGAFLGGIGWMVRRIDYSWARQVADGVSAPDGWLATALARAARGDDS